MQDKLVSRSRRALKTRMKIRQLGVYRLSVHRTPSHIYAQVIDTNGNIISSASTIDKAFRADHSDIKTGNAEAAALVGKYVGEKAKAKGIEKVAFDRSGFRYHGRVKALAEGARSSGLVF